MNSKNTISCHSSDTSTTGIPPNFVTDHLTLASFLASEGYDPVLQPTAAGTVLFAFEQTTALAADVAAFNGGTARVEPSAYNSARISLRREMDALRGGAR